MAVGWPMRIALFIGVIFLVQNLWSISRVRMEPLPVNHNLPKFSDIAKQTNPDYDRNQVYRVSIRSGLEGVKKECTPGALSELTHAVLNFYINAVGNAERAGVSRIEDAPDWSREDQRIDNYVAAMAEAGVLRREHFPRSITRAKGRIPLEGGDAPHVYPEWAEPPLTLGCPRA